jgi:pimeloyl-ACP methyl ester carboxylesterase
MKRCVLAAASILTALLLAPVARTQQGPCCSITGIDVRTAIVAAKIDANGQTFEFRANDAKLVSNLKIGQAVYANFVTQQVSLDGKTVCCSIIQGPQPARVVPARPSSTLTPIKGIPRPSCHQSWLSQYGGVICKSANSSRPAILLVHGLHQSAESWTKPSSAGYNYDHSHTPAQVNLGEHSAPNAGLYKAGTSDKLDVDPLNWFDYLAQQGFTVAAWSQPCCNFGAAYPSAQQALTQFAKDTAAMNPSAPPPIALVGHSRGGLVIHKLLREQGNLGGRIRWVITIHSPHHGSSVAKTPQVIAEDTVALFGGANLPADIKNPLREEALHAVSPLNQLIDDGSKELAPDSSLITGLLNGDAPVPGVQYSTFGGTSPTIVRLYTWLFTPMSTVPQYKNLEQYFDWQAKPAEVGLVSPLLDRVNAIVPEIRAGSGDSLVTDVSARLPYSVHESDQLNHAEVLWDRRLQQEVVRILAGPVTPPQAVRK